MAQKNFGQPVTKILHVFDPKVDAQNHEPISSLAKYLEKQLGELLPVLGVKPISVSCSLLQDACQATHMPQFLGIMLVLVQHHKSISPHHSCDRC